MRLLVCGNRDLEGEAWELTIAAWMQAIAKARAGRSVALIHGACGRRGAAPKGADSIAAEVAERLGWPVEAFPADWQKHGKAAGPIRNSLMLADGRPSRVLAFGKLFKPNGDTTGTGDMVVKAHQAGLIVTVVPRAGVLP